MANSDTAKVSASDWSKLAASRRSTRDFLAKPVPPSLLDEVLTDAMTAPSWSNTRPYIVAVATGEVRDRISAGMVSRWQILGATRRGGWKSWLSLAVRWGALARALSALPKTEYRMLLEYPSPLLERSRRIGRDLYALLGVARGDAKSRDNQWQRNYEFFGAPTEIFVFVHRKLGIPAASDAGLFMQNLMLGAKARGLGTCAQGAVAIWPDLVRQEFELPAGYRLLCGIALGYPSNAAVNQFAAERLPASEITAPVRPTSK
jgi:nitroreductase